MEQLVQIGFEINLRPSNNTKYCVQSIPILLTNGLSNFSSLGQPKERIFASYFDYLDYSRNSKSTLTCRQIEEKQFM